MSLSEAEKVLREMERMSAERLGSARAAARAQRARILVDIIHKIKPNRILEVGTLHGYSAILMGKELDSQAHLITIEIRENEAKIAQENIRRAQLKPKVDVLVGDAIEILPKLKGKFDLVFIDANKSEYLKYLELIEDKLHKESVVVADNASYEAVKDYLDHVRFSGKYDSKYIPLGADGVEVSERL